jgi:hypothetical protein
MEMYFREYAGNSPVTQPHPEDIPDHNNPHNAHISLLREAFFYPLVERGVVRNQQQSGFQVQYRIRLNCSRV